jgi:hypothetical protein
VPPFPHGISHCIIFVFKEDRKIAVLTTNWDYISIYCHPICSDRLAIFYFSILNHKRESGCRPFTFIFILWENASKWAAETNIKEGGENIGFDDRFSAAG